MKDSDIKKAMDPLYQKAAEDLSIWREQTLTLLPPIRKAQKEALARGDHDEHARLSAQYQTLIDALAAVHLP